MRGTGFEPRGLALLVLWATNPFLLFAHVRSLMRGTGFEPADPYGIAS